MHVTRLRVFSVEGFDRHYMNSYVKRQINKWDQDELDDLDTSVLDVSGVPRRDDPAEPGLDGVPLDERTMAPPAPERKAPAGPGGRCGQRQEEGEAGEAWCRGKSKVARALRSSQGQDGECKDCPGWEWNKDRRARGGGCIKAVFQSRLFSLRGLRGRSCGAGVASSSRSQTTGSEKGGEAQGEELEEKKSIRREPWGVFLRSEEAEEEEEESRGGYKRFYYNQLADPTGFESERECRGQERESKRRKEEETKEESWLPACQDPYQSDEWETETAGQRGWLGSHALWKEGEEQEGQEEATEEEEERGRGSRQLPRELSEWELGQQLRWRIGGGVIRKRGEEAGSSSQTEIEGEARVGLSNAPGPCEIEAGSISQGERGSKRPGFYDQGCQDVELLRHRCEEPDWELDGTSQRVTCHRVTSLGTGHRPSSARGTWTSWATFLQPASSQFTNR